MARHWGIAIEYKTSAPRAENPKDSHRFWDRAPLRWDTATGCKSDFLRDQRPGILSDFNVSTLDELPADSLSEAESVLATGAAEMTRVNQMAAITLKYGVFILTGDRKVPEGEAKKSGRSSLLYLWESYAGEP